MTKAAELAKMGEVLTNSQIGGRRNIIINGAMNVAQRATSATGVGASAGYFTCDRWKIETNATAGRATMSQTADVHDGFANCLKLDCTTADTSIAASELFQISHKLEGQDLQQLKKGTSSAESFTVSFYVKASGSFTFGLEAFDNDNDRQMTKLFTTTTDWVRHELTFPADTTGTLDDDNALSMFLSFWLHSGSTFTSGTLGTSFASSTSGNRAAGIDSFFSSTDNNFFLTGVQMEVGSQATPFEHRSFGEERQLCYRYYYQMKAATSFMKIGHGRAYDTSNTTATYPVPVPMRANPTGSVSANSDVGVAGLSSGGTTGTNAAAETFDDFSRFAINVTRSGADLTSGNIFQVESDNNTDMTIKLDAEL
tara:strand:- start:208 stop:1311 length:1104 start_codon:yes stop_codon:yes gene_type:complete